MAVTEGVLRVAYSGFGASELVGRHFPEFYPRLITSLPTPHA